jgi:transposase
MYDLPMATDAETIAELRRIIAEQSRQIEKLQERVAELELQLAKASKDSSNSSKSPSSDIVKPPKKKTDRRKKVTRGGQKGHARKLREPLPVERVDEQITYELAEEDVRQRELVVTDEFEIIQHIELLELPIYVTEHRLRKYRDSAGNTVLPEVAELKGQPIFGPRLLSMLGWLKSRAHCSYTTIALWMEDVLQVPVSRGYLAKLCNGPISASLALSHEELKDAVSEQSHLGSDETSLKNNGKKYWIWCITAPLFTLFHIATSRARTVLEELVGSEFAGFIHFDYFSANCSFAWNFDLKAQYCWAHLIRDIRFLLKHPNEPTRGWAEALLDRARRMFSAWHRREQMSEAGFHRSMLTHRDRFLAIVRDPPAIQEAANLMERFREVELQDGSFYDMSQDYFRFMFEPGVEPTNNHTEQQIRHCVIDRRITQGTRSEVGQRYHERMWSAIASCEKQNCSFFEFLHHCIDAFLNNKPHPSLLPK